MHGVLNLFYTPYMELVDSELYFYIVQFVAYSLPQSKSFIQTSRESNFKGCSLRGLVALSEKAALHSGTLFLSSLSQKIIQLLRFKEPPV